ncbi:MAG TPA: hypothetical protein VGX23_25060 [Actinocrinis sp.]|nr:hypothetical protein [Actinocrinis sp.]
MTNMSHRQAGLVIAVAIALMAGMASCVRSSAGSAQAQAAASLPAGSSYPGVAEMLDILQKSSVGCRVQELSQDSSTYCMTGNGSIIEIWPSETEALGSAYISSVLNDTTGPSTLVAGPNWVIRVYDDDDQASLIATLLNGVVLHGGVPVPAISLPHLGGGSTLAGVQAVEARVSGAVACRQWQGSPYFPRSQGCSSPDGLSCLEVHSTTSTTNRDTGIKYEFGLIGAPAVVVGANWYVTACSVAQGRSLASSLGGTLVTRPGS